MFDNNAQDRRRKPRVLYVHYGDNWLRGSEIVLLDLLKLVKDNHYTPVLWCNSDTLATKASELGIKVILDNFVCLGYWTLPRWNFIRFFKLQLKAKKLLKQYDISIVHCNNGAPCQWMVPLCKITNTPLLLHLHARYLFRDRLILLFSGADSIIGVSQSVTNVFKANECKHQQVDVIYNGIDPKRVLNSNPRNIRAELSAKDTDFVIMYMGSLIPRKSVDTLLYAIDKLKSNYNVKLAIIGSGSEQNKLINLANQLQLNDTVTFISASDKVDEIYSSNADCFISVPLEEVFGLTLAEASLAKLPVITSDIPGINEIYTDQQNALLIQPNNIDALVSAISSLIKAPSLRKRLAESAQKHIGKTYSLKQQFVAFNLAYQGLLQDWTKRSITQTISLQGKILVKAFVNKSYEHLALKFSGGGKS
jgi:glycosyltransferase involved in cell wall biosynthesis